MSSTFASLLRPWLTRWLVCLIAACIPLQGVALVRDRIEDAAHVHVDVDAAASAALAEGATARSPALSAPSAPVGRPSATWNSVAPMWLDVAVLRHSHGAARVASAGSGAASASHFHAHAAVARHLHEPDDATVLRVDDAPSPPDIATGKAPKRLLLDVDGPPVAGPNDAGVSSRLRLLRPVVSAWTEVPGSRLERPPRAAPMS